MPRSIYWLLASLLFFSCSPRIIPSSEISQQATDQPTYACVMIDAGNSGLGPCEPSICIDPTNKDRVVAGAILDKVYTSEDGGLTWTKDKLRSPYGVYGDPVVRANYQGDFFYAHLSNPTGKAYASEEFLDRIVIQRSEDGGHTWTDGSYTLPRSPKDQDKQWLVVDPKDNTLYITWTEFDLYDSPDPQHRSRILFSKSTDTGDSWTEPLTLSQQEGDCLDDDQTTEGAVPAVGPDGEIYVAWSYDEKIYFDKSLDRGVTWLQDDMVIATQPGGWTFDIAGLTRCNGMPITGVDLSQSKHRGTIYVNWADQRNGSDDTDIWLVSSTDNGESWTAPTRVNDDTPGSQQFLSWMTIDQSSGYIYVVFYDRRHHTDISTDVYLAVSKDGGQTFENTQINSQSFQPSQNVFFGDYNDISAEDGRVRPIWTQLEGKQLSIWTAIIEMPDSETK